MIDMHSHLIYGVDDGSKSLHESISIIKGLSNKGFTDIIITPHYIHETSYNSSKKENIKILNSIKKELKKEKININVFLGNEIYIDNNILQLLKDGFITSLNDSKYLLIELPMSGEFQDYYDIFRELLLNKYQVILAHPERYTLFQKDYEKIKELHDLGVLFQCNLGSSISEYGKNAKKTLKKMLKDNLVYVIGTDIHHEKDYELINKAVRKIIKYSKNKDIFKNFEINAKNIINND